MEAEPRLQERHLAMIFNSARDMMLLAKVEPTGLFRVVSVNRPYLETVRAAGFTLAAADIEGKTFAGCVALFGFDVATAERMRARFEQAIRTRQPLEFAEITETPAGTFHGHTTLTPITDATGECSHVLYSSHDITARLRAEQALRESEEKFAKAFRACPDAMSVHELESGRYVDVNEGFVQLFGYTREEVIGRIPLELGLWTAAADRDEFVTQLREKGRVRHHNVQARLRDGTIRTCELSAERIEIGGRPHNVTVLKDITENLEAEQALRFSEDKFARAFRASPDAISISEVITGRLLEINEGFERLSGYPRAELIGRTAAELGLWAVPGDRERLMAELERSGSVRNLQIRVRNRSGEESEFLFSGEAVQIGRQPCLVIVAHDISNRLRAEQALRESEEKFARAFRSSPQSLIISDLATGRYIDVNVGFERVTGYSRDEVIGRTSLEVGVWDNTADRDELVRRLKRDGMARDLEMTFRRKDGGRLITRCSFETVELSGRPCMLSTINDITEQRQAEQQKASLEAQLRQNQKLEALGTLAGGIAHDFNNILTAIIINQELALMDMHEPADLRRRLTEIGRASSRAKDLVREILTFSRQQRHEKHRQQLQLIVREALSLLRASLPATIEIDQDLSP
ncbi:MAG TPA: PAS domain S-box protein, partial [Lacunisphaera sp.]|nr:PAS domain S-box protein [Lacunisphaera sp.]